MHTERETTPADRSEPRTRGNGLPGWGVLVVAALGFWLVGALPWLFTGLRQPAFGTWLGADATETPRVALPFAPGTLGLLAIVTTTGGILAQLAAYLGRHPRPAGPGEPTEPRPSIGNALWALLGAGLGAAATIAQCAHATAGSLADTPDSDLLVSGLTATAALSSTLGLVAGLAVVAGAPWLRTLGLAVTAAALPAWVSALLLHDRSGAPDLARDLASTTPWVLGVVLGVALGTLGLIPARRLVTWVLALGIAWVLPAGLTAIGYLSDALRSSTAQPGALRDLLGSVAQVLAGALGRDAHALGPYLLALVVGIAGSALQRRRTQPSEVEPEPAEPHEPAERHTDDAEAAGGETEAVSSATARTVAP